MKYFSLLYIILVSVMLLWVFGEYMPICTLESAADEGVRKECECVGWELVLRDDLDVGGLRKTVCLGVAKSTECFAVSEDGWEKTKCR